MSTFTEHKTTADRSASDRRRHKQKIEKAIKEGLKDIVAEESITGLYMATMIQIKDPEPQVENKFIEGKK